MKNTMLSLIIAFTLFIGLSFAEERIYKQIKSLSINNTGKINQTKDKADLFELTFNVDMKNNIIKRTYVKRLDGKYSTTDESSYNISGISMVFDDNNPNAIDRIPVIIAHGMPGTNTHEMLEMGNDFLFTTRTSGLSQIVTGVYERVRK